MNPYPTSPSTEPFSIPPLLSPAFDRLAEDELAALLSDECGGRAFFPDRDRDRE